MNTATRLRIVSADTLTAVVSPYGFDMTCEYEYQAAELPILFGSNSHPGSPANAQLLTCKVGSIEITDMLTNGQRERIEDLIISDMENT